MKKVLIIAAILAVITLTILGSLQFSTIGQFTFASFELDEYGLFYGGEALSFEKQNSGWDSNKMFITSDGVPTTSNNGYLRIPPEVGEININQYIILPKTSLEGKDVRMVFGYSGHPDVTPLLRSPASLIVGLKNDVNCQKRLGSPMDDLQVLDWKSSNLQPNLGALFINGIKVCEKTITTQEQLFIQASNGLKSLQGDDLTRFIPEMRVYAIGQRLPFNCRIDPTHEEFVVDTAYGAGTKIKLDTFTFKPVAFCKESPVVRVASQPIAGVTSTTEPFLKWGLGETLIVPDNEVWLVSYVSDWQREGRSSGCGIFDVFSVENQTCASEARIAVVTQQLLPGISEVTTTSEAGKVTSENKIVISLEDAKKEDNLLLLGIIVVGALLIIFGIIWLVRR